VARQRCPPRTARRRSATRPQPAGQKPLTDARVSLQPMCAVRLPGDGLTTIAVQGVAVILGKPLLAYPDATAIWPLTSPPAADPNTFGLYLAFVPASGSTLPVRPT
jgi:hypothetical protein